MKKNKKSLAAKVAAMIAEDSAKAQKKAKKVFQPRKGAGFVSSKGWSLAGPNVKALSKLGALSLEPAMAFAMAESDHNIVVEVPHIRVSRYGENLYFRAKRTELGYQVQTDLVDERGVILPTAEQSYIRGFGFVDQKPSGESFPVEGERTHVGTWISLDTDLNTDTDSDMNPYSEGASIFAYSLAARAFARLCAQEKPARKDPVELHKDEVCADTELRICAQQDAESILEKRKEAPNVEPIVKPVENGHIRAMKPGELLRILRREAKDPKKVAARKEAAKRSALLAERKKKAREIRAINAKINDLRKARVTGPMFLDEHSGTWFSELDPEIKRQERALLEAQEDWRILQTKIAKL